jgi:capsular exopolysaccharide synthesis family protein
MSYYFDAIQRASGRDPARTDPSSDEIVDAVAKTRVTPVPLSTLAPKVVEFAGKQTREKRKCKFNPSDSDVIVTTRTNLELSDILAIEQFRNLRVRLSEIGRTRPLQTIVITSANPKEGKTTVCLNLAFASSQVKDKRTLLVDADLRRPSVARLLGISKGPSLTDYLSERADYDELPWEISPNLDVITASETSEASELLQVKRLSDFIRECSERYDYVFIDSPPLGSVADAQTLAAGTDGVLLVVRAGGKRELVAIASERIKSKILGVVLNFGRSTSKQSYHYGTSRPDEGSVRRKQK